MLSAAKTAFLTAVVLMLVADFSSSLSNLVMSITDIEGDIIKEIKLEPILIDISIRVRNVFTL